MKKRLGLEARIETQEKRTVVKCDRMLEKKVAKFLQKVAQKVDNAVLT